MNFVSFRDFLTLLSCLLPEFSGAFVGMAYASSLYNILDLRESSSEFPSRWNVFFEETALRNMASRD